MNKPCILHLENNIYFIEQVKWIIDDKQVSYDYAVTAKEANKKLKQRKPDLLVVDLMLSNDFDTAEGIDFIEKIDKKEYPEMKIMVLSARSDSVYRHKLAEKIDQYQTKDDIEEACDRMMNLLGYSF